MNFPYFLPLPRFDAMDYAVPQFSIQEVNSAGRMLASFDGSSQEISHSIAVIDNWRAAHGYPLQSFYVTLKRRALKVHRTALAVQRTKRLVSIALKLMREKGMKLSQMQDIGGCRAILPSIDNVRELEQVYKNSRWDHTWLRPKDYITNPKPSGYRSIHLKYRFSGKGDKSSYDGLKIEIQLRTRLQHIWATAVEAADTFTDQALKSSGGKKEWQRFFALMGSVFAMKEDCPLVPGTPTTFQELAAELKQLNRDHKFGPTFAGYTAILPQVVRKSDATYFLVSLDPEKLEVTIKGFKKNESKQANEEYTDAEKQLEKESKKQVVLVSVSSVSSLKRAYPNYFMDTHEFLEEFLKVVSS